MRFFLFPKASNQQRFEEANQPKGFDIEVNREGQDITPQTVSTFIPAVLTGSGKRWEVLNRGVLSVKKKVSNTAATSIPSSKSATNKETIGLSPEQDKSNIETEVRDLKSQIQNLEKMLSDFNKRLIKLEKR